MAEDESYEIMPYKEIVNLKKEIENLKKKTGDTSSQELINSMSKLTKSMDSMLQLFRTAAEEMAAEKTTEDRFADKLDPLLDKLNEVIDQNKTIAGGMVAIADIVKGKQGKSAIGANPPIGPGHRGVDIGLQPKQDELHFPPPIAEPDQGYEGPEHPEAPPMFSPGGPSPPPPGNLPPLEPLGPPPGPGGSFGGLPPLQEKAKKRGLFGFRKK